MPATEELEKLVQQLPNADRRGMLTENIAKEQIETAIAAMAKGGREYVLGLIDLLGEPGSEENVKPHFALHCLANHILATKDEDARQAFGDTLAAELSNEDRPNHIKAYLCQELGWAGRGEAAEALGGLLTDEELCAPASMALVAIGDGAAEQFRAAWPKAEGKARLHIIDGIAATADEKSAAILTNALADDDREVRIAAGAGLSKIASADGIEPLTEAAKSASGWEKTQAAKNCLVLAETLAGAGATDDAKRAYEALKAAAGEAEHVGHAVELGLARLSVPKS